MSETPQNPQVRYYLLKDYNLITLFLKLLAMSKEVQADMQFFIELYAQGAQLHSVRTDGNLQIRYMAFDWIYPSIDKIPKNTYKNLRYTKNGIVVTLDAATINGKKIQEDQMEMLHYGTIEAAEVWYGELYALLNWGIDEEPGFIYDIDRRVFVIVTDKWKPHGEKAEYKPPLGVVHISKDRFNELLPHLN